ncbi:MAG: C1 family peptidase [Actinomycetota bacterium]|nr:C1 family peptidase [Actinomycetota bacterium]
MDLRPRLGPPRSQGPRSTCLAFAVSAAHEGALFASHDMVDLCEEFLYWAAKEHDTPGPGTTFTAARGGLDTYGQPLEEEWPYDTSRDDQVAGYAPPASAMTATPRWSLPLSPVSATPDSVRGELDATRAVALGIPTWPALDHPVSGRLGVPRLADLDGAHHAVAVVGYNTVTAELLIRNSWGPTWGDNGSAWLQLRFLEVHVCEAWVVGSPVLGTAEVPAQQPSARYGDTNEEL